MGRGVGPAGCLIIAMLACLRGAAETEHMVGGSGGWTASPSITAGCLLKWAAGKTFTEGDTLKFVLNGTHDVTVVSREVYDTCGDATPLFETGSGDVLLYWLGEYGNVNGQYHFISTVDSDCENGQKLAITIINPTLAESPGSSASSTTAGVLSVLVLSSASIITMLMN